jgi:hypothetical protein
MRIARIIVAEHLFRILFEFTRNVTACVRFNPRTTEEDSMKKFGYVIAALGAIAIAAPSIASAETVVIRHGDRDHHRGYDARAEFREHRDHGWHEGWRHRHADRVAIVKHRHHEY